MGATGGIGYGHSRIIGSHPTGREGGAVRGLVLRTPPGPID